MAAAGPAANFTLVLVAGAIMKIGLASGWLVPGGFSTTELVVTAAGSANAGTAFLSVVFTLNLILGTFNLLPVPPLDGHAVIGLFMDTDTAAKWTRWAREPMFALLGLLLACKVFGWVFRPVFGFAVGLLF
jgi:Zn-dependent protease